MMRLQPEAEAAPSSAAAGNKKLQSEERRRAGSSALMAAAVTWQDFAEHLGDCDGVEHAAVLALDGTVWGASPDFAVYLFYAMA